MEVIFGLEPLRAALGRIKPARPTGRQAVGALAGILIEAAAGRVSLASTNGDIYIRAIVIGADIIAPGRMVIPEKLNQIIGSAPKGELITIRDALLPARDKTAEPRPCIEVRVGRSKFTLEPEDPAKFPACPEPQEATAIRVTAGALARQIAATVKVTDSESTRYALSGCLFEYETALDTFRLVGTDGSRLHQAEAHAPAQDDPQWDSQRVVPARALKAMQGILGLDQDAEIVVELSRALARFSDAVGSWSLTARLVEGRFPTYRDVYPKGAPSATIRLESSAALAHLVGLAAITTDKQIDRTIEIEATEAGLLCWSVAADVGQCEAEDRAIVLEGSPFHTTFLPGSLAEALEAIGPDTPLTLEYHGPKAALVVKAGAFTAALMSCSSDRQARRVKPVEPAVEAEPAAA